MKFSRFTSHYSIFNQLALHQERMFLNISSISILSNRFLKILSKFFIQLRAPELNFVEPQIGAFYNIEPIYPSFKSISKLFLSFSINFSISSLLLPASPGGAKRDIIYHLILLCQAEFYFLFVFYSARLVPSPSVGGEQGHNIAQPRNLSNAFPQNIPIFLCFRGVWGAISTILPLAPSDEQMFLLALRIGSLLFFYLTTDV